MRNAQVLVRRLLEWRLVLCGVILLSGLLLFGTETKLVKVVAAAAPRAEAGPAHPLILPQAVIATYRDALTLPDKDAHFYRYFWIPVGEKDRAEFLQIFALHLNLLSTQPDPGSYVLVAPDVIRIDLRVFGLDKQIHIFERLKDKDIFFHTQVEFLKSATVKVYWPGGPNKAGKEIDKGVYAVDKERGDRLAQPAFWANPPVLLAPDRAVGAQDLLREILHTEVPILNAQWFFVQSARQTDLRNNDNPGTGYYDFLGIKDRKAFFDIIGLNEALAVKLFKEWRAVVPVSGVSQQNRQIVALKAVTGTAWVTLDTFVEDGRGIAKTNLRRGEFAHNAEEWFGFLPNGLPITPLFDNLGNRVASAPDKIGPDDSPGRIGRDGRIHTNLSCIRCHGINTDMLKPIDDWARKTFRQGGVLKLQDADFKIELELKRQYLSDMDRILKKDRDDYTYAIHRATLTPPPPGAGPDGKPGPGLTPSKMATLYGNAWNVYVEGDARKPTGVTLEVAARELGTTKERFVESLKKYQGTLSKPLTGKVDLVLVGLLDTPSQNLPRLEWEARYAFSQTLVAGLLPPELIKKVKPAP